MKKSEEEQKIFDEWYSKLPNEIEKFYTFLSENVKKFQTFDLLSFFSYYNHLHDSEKYSDFRDGKNFFVSEVLALLCLKNDFVNRGTVSQSVYMHLIMELQQTVINYCGRSDALEEFKPRSKDVISEIANLLSREARHVRNPGLPDHHFILAEKLFEPLKDEVNQILGFSFSDSITIRKCLPEMINQKCRTAIDGVLKKVTKYIKMVQRFKKAKIVESESVFTKEQLEEYSKYSYEKLKFKLKVIFLNELYYTFGTTYTFTAKELSEFSKVDLASVTEFLRTFSCGFPSLNEENRIYEPITILKTKPIVEHDGKYLIPSFPLVIWAVEDWIEESFKTNKKFNKKYSIVKHNFLLNQGLELFKSLLPTATIHQPNLFYSVNGDIFETDGLIIYDQVLFIIEAKGHRITQRAKKGFTDRTEKHLEEIVQESYEQGIRTLKHIEDSEVAEFKTKKGEQVLIKRIDFDEIIIVSLTIESVGNFAMSIKATNEIGYFKNNHFPWIISLYDLIVIADLFENPLMLVHYIKRRKKFLSTEMLSVYEELDLVAYYMSNGLYIEHDLNEAKVKDVRDITYMSNTDGINDYYMYKFGHKTKFTPKPNFYISKELNDFLLQLDNSRMPHRVRMALLILEFGDKSLKLLMSNIKKTKASFAADKKLHDNSIYSKDLGGIGITFMSGISLPELQLKLHQYCNYKLTQLNSRIWLGFGDVSTELNNYSFRTMFFFDAKIK